MCNREDYERTLDDNEDEHTSPNADARAAMPPPVGQALP
jgi:hypothetical protein